MADVSRPDVECELQHPLLRVPDLSAAVDFYTTRLGFTLGFMWGEPPSMAGLNLGGVQIFLGQGTPAPQGCGVYFVVGNADELYEYHRANGVEIDRVDVPVRLEKRLAALIQDLAEYKRMSLSSLLEETLLHTLDGVGPHTKSDLKRIVQLKQKHGIDYDSHGSYGFVER
jgi:catechol 2,3-dioxygenase-like lactoylglutathione lyase family enzyme